MDTIPSKARKEWRQLLEGKLNVQFSNFILQMRINQAQRDLKKGKLTMMAAIDEIHSLCEKYAIIVQQDMKQIFK